MTVRTYRDAHGVPHVRAGSLLSLAHGQGEVTGRDRAWQLEHLRRRATGTSAAVLGPSALAWDRLARRATVAATARRAHAALEPETRAFVAAYVAGVNAGLHSDAPELRALGIAAEPWEEWTPLAVFLTQHLLFGSLPGKLWAHRAREVLGEDAALLSQEGPQAGGSNAWAVGGARTRTGSPMIGGDPHRVIEAPGVYQQVRLACEDPDDPFDVVGFTFPGVPGVQHFAHAGGVAWAITNAYADYQDVYAERLRREGGRVEALGPDGWETATSHVETVEVADRADEEVEVVVTARGPVLEGGPDEGAGLSLRAASVVLADLGFDALLPLLRARTVADVDLALDRWVEPVNNVVVADTTGAVRYRVAGRIPLRQDANRRGIVDAADPATAWGEWLTDLPRHDVPPDGHVVTANERRGPESDRIGTVFASPHRARRIHDLLDGRDHLVPEDFAEIHGDTLSLEAVALTGLVREVEKPIGPAGAVREQVLAWDHRMDATSTGAAAYAAWRSGLVRRLAADPVFAPLLVPVHDQVFPPWLDLTTRIGLALETLYAAGSPYGLDLRAHARAALTDAVAHPEAWGATHVVTPVHAFDLATDLEPPPVPALPVSGDTDCVRCTASVPGVTDACVRGSVARYVWDLADRQASGWVVPTGAHADPADPHHHDQLPLWVAGGLAPVITDWDRLEQEP
ncbi:penicillin acylase family protein [Nocardioides dongkuii]|uniref:penicillin acylase family protein n=1 Tax=Nocardioides dongkuii TaxID=2760089 RepID=UPI0015FA2D4C|nr:penicillin acylase family protein [Nocardioides dongkuii]